VVGFAEGSPGAAREGGPLSQDLEEYNRSVAEDKRDERENQESTTGWASGMGTLAEYSVVGFVFPLALVIGFFVGQWVGNLFGGPTVGAVVGVLLGTAAGFYNLWETIARIERREAERTEDEEEGGGRSG
jgi:F0F1-type ATP synthase assembly protein I